MTGATITFTGTTTATNKVGIAAYATGIDVLARFIQNISAVPFFQGTARNIGGQTFAASKAGDLMLGLWSFDGTETSMAGANGFTVGPTFTGAGYYTGNTLSLSATYLIATNTSAIEPKGTGGISPTAYGAGGFLYRAAASTYSRRRAHDGLVMRASALRPTWKRAGGIWLPDRGLWRPTPAPILP